MSKTVQLIYTSRETKFHAIAELESILLQSRKNNARVDITGMLLYRKSCFIQVLEGPENSVQSVYASIRKDRRHKDVTTVYENVIGQRDFPNWAMAFYGFEPTGIEGMSDFLLPLLSKDDSTISEGEAKQLLTRFRELNSL